MKNKILTEAKDPQLTSRYCMVEYTGQEWVTLRYTPRVKNGEHKVNVNDAMETAAAYWAAHEQEQEPLFDSEEVAITLANEVGRLRAELAAAKAASVLPVGITDLELSESGHRIEFYLEGDKTDGAKMLVWLRDRMKERGEK